MVDDQHPEEARRPAAATASRPPAGSASAPPVGSARPPGGTTSLGRAAALLAFALFALVPACWAVVALFGAFPGDREVAADVAEEDLG